MATVLAQSCTVLAIGWQVYDLSRMTMGVKAAALRLERLVLDAHRHSHDMREGLAA